MRKHQQPSTRSKGFSIEDKMVGYLSKQGLILIEKNYRSRWGEIDIIMKKNDILAFIEVRYRCSNLFGLATETVTKHKQKKIINASYDFLSKNKCFENYNIRFDILGVEPTIKKTKRLKISWIKNAFTPEY